VGQQKLPWIQKEGISYGQSPLRKAARFRDPGVITGGAKKASPEPAMASSGCASLSHFGGWEVQSDFQKN